MRALQGGVVVEQAFQVCAEAKNGLVARVGTVAWLYSMFKSIVTWHCGKLQLPRKDVLRNLTGLQYVSKVVACCCRSPLADDCY
jgi:putative exporter of polyketide antibiotics